MWTFNGELNVKTTDNVNEKPQTNYMKLSWILFVEMVANSCLSFIYIFV